MRVTPLLGKKLWFRPRRCGGWGWQPASWEGWFVIAATVLAYLICGLLVRGALNLVILVGITIVLIAVCALKGTSPGGRRELIEFQRVTGQ